MPIALDTNVLVYVEGLNGRLREAEAKTAITRFDPRDIWLPAQVLAELFAVQVRKFAIAPTVARTRTLEWANGYPVLETTVTVLDAAMDLTSSHRIAFWDAVVLASAAEGSCDTLLSEDFQPGFTWRGVTVVNPFAPA